MKNKIKKAEMLFRKIEKIFKTNKIKKAEVLFQKIKT